MKKTLIVFLMIIAFGSGFFGKTLMNARAEARSISVKNRYYTSIQIKQGDNLWSVANLYSKNSGYTTQEYMEELKRMNNLKSEQIQSGEYLTVVYAAE